MKTLKISDKTHGKLTASLGTLARALSGGKQCNNRSFIFNSTGEK
jgi:hypothetical protein